MALWFEQDAVRIPIVVNEGQSCLNFGLAISLFLRKKDSESDCLDGFGNAEGF